MDIEEAHNFVQTYSLKKGLKHFGDKGKKAVEKEILQLHNRKVFEPIHTNELTALEKKRAMESLIFLTEKQDETVKARTCANGSTQRTYVTKEEAASPTAATESVILTASIEAKQQRDVITLDTPNAFVQTDMPQGGHKVVMKIRGLLVDILISLCPGVYEDYVVHEQGQKVIYVMMLKALYGMLVSSILFYKKFRKDIESIGFVVNPFDICVTNRKVNGSQQTLTWHVDDIKASHIDPKVNKEFFQWCENTYGSELNGHVKVVKGKRHDYLGMILDFTKDGCLIIDMKYYIKKMLEDFLYKVKTNKMPWNDKLFKEEQKKKLDNDRKEIFHQFVMKAMFLTKRARPDINPGVNFLSTRVKDPHEGDWKKLLKLLGFLKGTIDDVLIIELDDKQIFKWYVDAAFAVHADMKSHTGAVLMMGKGGVICESTKQKVNSRSSTEAELIAVDDKISKIMWTKRFAEHQGFKILIIVYQDNESSIKLEVNGKESSGKRTRHFNIQYFYITDLISRKEVEVVYCPTENMIADFMTKPTTGPIFKKYRQLIMNIE